MYGLTEVGIMTPKQYCFQKIAQPGSALYFCVRQLPQSQRDAFIAIFAFYHEIEEVILNYEDPQIAQVKLNWWRDEVIKIKDSKPSHPVALALQDSIVQFGLNPLKLIDIIDGFEESLALVTFSKFEDLVIYIMRTAGVRECLIAEVLKKANPKDDQVETKSDSSPSRELTYQLTIVVELVNYLQHLRRYVRHDLIYFSEDELQKFSVTKSQLHEYITTKNIHDLLKFQAEKVERSFQKAQNDLAAHSYPQLKNLIVRCEIARAILRAMQSSGFRLLENFITITPLKCWWIVWTKT